ncbi:MAG TPA: hypothetical protein VK900_14745, partial [Anaerolineales bacterium]|nr:hypothetical protein [Anaerolineales bacterium]
EDMYDRTRRRSMIACERTPEVFRYELLGRSQSNNCGISCIIENQAGESVGFFTQPGYLYGTSLLAARYEVAPGNSWLEVTPSLVRYLWTKGQEYAKRDGGKFDSFGFSLGASHPAYDALGNRLPTIRDPYAWYLRMPDLRGFLEHIKPVLEKRLAESLAANHSGEMLISLYRTGLRLVIERGTLTAIESWKPSPKQEGDAAFPDLTFLQLLFGYRSYAELEYALADCWCFSEDVRVLLNILFPKKLSSVYPIA